MTAVQQQRLAIHELSNIFPAVDLVNLFILFFVYRCQQHAEIIDKQAPIAAFVVMTAQT
jgi:hypothetical protein